MAFWGGADRREVEALRRRVTQLETVVQELCRRAGSDPAVLFDQATGVSERVRGLAAGGRKIEAIKAHREETGSGLAEAKRVVDGL